MESCCEFAKMCDKIEILLMTAKIFHYNIVYVAGE